MPVLLCCRCMPCAGSRAQLQVLPARQADRAATERGGVEQALQITTCAFIVAGSGSVPSETLVQLFSSVERGPAEHADVAGVLE